MILGLLHTLIRGDEKLIIKSARDNGVKIQLINVAKEIFNPDNFENGLDVLLERCVSTTLGMHAIAFYESRGLAVVNKLSIAQLCNNKFATSLALKEAKVPTVPFAMAFSEDGVLEVVEQLGGFPVVIKPVSGSWGRLLAKINDRDALEAVVEQKLVLGSPLHKAFYVQKFVDKPERDIRLTLVDGKVICAIYREAKHWITNTARGAKAKKCKVDENLREIGEMASRAVGGGVLGVDVFETKNGYVVNEVNHTTEFKNVQAVTKIDVAGEIIKYCIKVARND